MGNLKTSGEEKVKFINEVINVLDGGVFGGAIDSIRKQKTLDLRYKKAQYFNRTYELGVKGRKSDRFGESKKLEVNKEVVKDDLEESNDEFIGACLEAEKEVKVSSYKEDFEAATEPIEENEIVDLELVKEAISRGIKVFYSSFFKSDKEIRKVGYKNNIVDIYYIKNVGLIEVDKNN